MQLVASFCWRQVDSKSNPLSNNPDSNRIVSYSNIEDIELAKFQFKIFRKIQCSPAKAKDVLVLLVLYAPTYSREVEVHFLRSLASFKDCRKF